MRNIVKRFVLFVLVLAVVFPYAVSLADTLSSPNAVKIKGATVTLVKKSGEYNGKSHAIEVKVVKDGVELVEGVDYIVSGNETSKSKAGTYTVKLIIVGIGHYKGNITKSFKYTIKKTTQTLSVKPQGGKDVIEVNASDVKEGSLKVQVDIADVVLDELISGKLVWKTTARIKVNSEGVITLPKGLKRGTYKIKVYAAAGTNYEKSSYQYITIVVS